MNPFFTLNPLSLQFKLNSPVLPDPSSLQRSSGSGPSDQALIRPVLLPSALPPAISGHPSPGTSSPHFHLSLSSRHGFGVAPTVAHQLSPFAASSPHLPESLENLAPTIAEQYSYLPESLGVGVTETMSTIQELPSGGSSLIVMPYTQPGDDKREFFQKSGMDRIHASKPATLFANGLAPGGSRVPPQSQAAHVRPTIPPGFNPLTHGPGLDLIDAAKPVIEKNYLANELDPVGSRAASRVGQVRPTIPPGFNPPTHGPGMARIHNPVREDAASRVGHVRPTIPPGFNPPTHGPGMARIHNPVREDAASRVGHVRPTIPPGFNPPTHGPGMARIHNPVREDAASRVGHVRPTIPPGFNPPTHGPGMARIHNPVREDAASRVGHVRPTIPPGFNPPTHGPGMARIHNPVREDAASRVGHVRPTIPPGFNPPTHGPGMARIHNPVREDAASRVGHVRPTIPPGFNPPTHGPGMARIHNPVREDAASRVGHVRPTIPPGFNPPTHGPGMARIHNPVREDAASTHTSSGTSNLNYTVVRQILNSQMEMSNRIMSIQENNMNLFNRLVNLKNETREKMDKMDASIITSVQPLIGRIEAMESRGAEKERLYLQILSSDQEDVKTIEDEIEFLEEQNNAEKEEEKSEAKKKKGLKYLGFGGIILAGIGATYLYLKK